MFFILQSLKNIFVHSSGKLLLFIVLINLTNFLSTTDFADYILFLNLFSLSLLFSTLGIPQFIIRMIKNQNSHLFKVVILSLVSNLILNIIFIFIFSFLLNIELNVSLSYIFLFFTISSFNATLLSILHGYNKVLFADFLDFLLKPLIIFISVFFIYFTFSKNITFSNVVLSYLLSQFILFLILIIKISLLLRDISDQNFETTFNKNFFFKSIFFLGATSFLHIFNSRIDIFMINFYLDDLQLAEYGLALQLFAIVNFPILAIRSIFIPKFYDHIKNLKFLEANDQLNLIKIGILYLHIILIILITLFGKKIFIIFFNQNYHDSVNLLVIYLIFNMFTLPFLLSEVILHSLHKEHLIPSFTFFSAIINILMNLIFIPLMGVYGALFSTIFCNFLVHFLMYLAVFKFNNNFILLNFGDFKNFNNYLKINFFSSYK